MSISNSELRSKLGRVKGLGAAHHGVGHWWWQRLTAVVMVPLSIWFLCGLLTSMLSPDIMKPAEWFLSPVNMLAMVFLLIAVCVHMKLGLQVVIEDYIKPPVMKYTLLLFVTFACFALIGIGLAAILKLHFLYATSATV